MARGSNHQEVGAKFPRDASQGMTEQHMGLQCHTLFLGHGLRALEHVFVSMIRILALGFDLSDWFGKRCNLFDLGHMQFRLVLLGKIARKFERLERRTGAIVRV
jgi:hypothetical protein